MVAELVNLEAMTDGELDVLCEVRLFGGQVEAVGKRGGAVILRDGVFVGSPRRFSTWEGMGLVVEAMRARGLEFQLIAWRDGTNSARFTDATAVGWVKDVATAPRAVCIAALLAVGLAL